MVWRDLLSDADTAKWFTSAELDSANLKNIIGDSYADRLHFPTDTSNIVHVDDLHALKEILTITISRISGAAAREDTLVIVICGHGEQGTGNVLTGGRGFLTKRAVEFAIEGIAIPRERIFLVSTACYSGLWRSSKWTLIAGAESKEVSITIAQLGSGEYRGTGPQRSMGDAIKFMEDLRQKTGGIYKFLPFVLDPVSESPALPLRPFTSDYLDRFTIVGPSPPSIPEEPESSTWASGSRRCSTPPSPPPPLSAADAAELLRLATAHARYPRASTPKDLQVNSLSTRLSAGGIITPTQQHDLLAQLRYSARACRSASAIAHYLGWQPARSVEWGRPSGLAAMDEAEAAGAAIWTKFASPTAEGVDMGEGEPVWRTMGPGAWLADAWVGAGRPRVEKERWDAAVAFANRVADVGGRPRSGSPCNIIT
ncbi:hypothetical protein B0H11DRAFT_508585 [Mycena galericulata]|nr:hypothetical protein B0H11DRAFT_508585 [Mycena galericulata]